MNHFYNQQLSYSNEARDEMKKLIENEKKLMEEKIQSLRIENTKEAKGMKLRSDEFFVETKKTIEFREDLKRSFNENVNKLNEEFDMYKDEFKMNIKEYNKIKRRFVDLIEFIKDVRFRRNLVDFDGIKRSEIRELTMKLNYSSKSNNKFNKKGNLKKKKSKYSSSDEDTSYINDKLD